jgi:hypothetical protein
MTPRSAGLASGLALPESGHAAKGKKKRRETRVSRRS